MRKYERPSPRPPSPRGASPSLTNLDAPLVRRLAGMFGLLSSPTRIRILHALAVAGELHVQAVAAAVRMKVTAVSNQLRLMAMLGVLAARAEGLRVMYSVNEEWVVAMVEEGIAQSRGRRARRR